MAIHHDVLSAAQRISVGRSRPEFTPDEIVRALPQHNAQSVRTHVTSRCCINAVPHHQSRLAYFRKIARGRYELVSAHRVAPAAATRAPRNPGVPGRPQRDTIHAVVTRDGNTYVVDCHEVAVVTQGRTLDEALANLTEAVALHLEGEDLRAMGLAGLRHIHVSYELPADVNAA